ncbi:MAG TPA: glycine oxidase ThiO [Acidimicrobiales bacterium]|nr:glycine oxidase ThiO [Acidimicrobiales bacterium]
MTSSAPSTGATDVAVVGGGPIGLATAWRLAGAGASVTVFDPAPDRGAWRVAAGMLAPVTEVHYGEEPLLGLNLESAALYPAFCAELEDATGLSCGYRSCGTLAVAADNDDLAALRDLQAFQERLGLEVARLSSRQCRAMVPSLSPSVRGGLHVAGDHQVDPRRLVGALREACSVAGVRLVREAVVRLDSARGRVAAVVTAHDAHPCAAVVVAAGAWSGLVDGLATMVPVRPVKGQVVRLAGADPDLIGLNLRALVAGSSVYLVPRADGEVVIGATVEEKAYDPRVTAGAVHDLLRDSWSVVPELRELEVAELSAGFRPGTPDNAPLIGPAAPVGVFLATGHYRNGVLLTPVTAQAVATAVLTGRIPDVVAPFSPLRFGERAA